jgi:hypothetical protein
MGTIPTIPDFTAGEVLTAAKMDSMSAAVAFWALTPRCFAYASATGQTLATATYAAVALDSEVYDYVQSGDSPHHDNATQNTRIVIRTAGLYEIVGQVGFANNATGGRIAQVRVNNSAVAAGSSPAVSGLGTNVMTGIVERRLAIGDYVEIFGYQTSGGTLGIGQGADNTFLRVKLTGT